LGGEAYTVAYDEEEDKTNGEHGFGLKVIAYSIRFSAWATPVLARQVVDVRANHKQEAMRRFSVPTTVRYCGTGSVVLLKGLHAFCSRTDPHCSCLMVIPG
jgi:hypothetical protein